MNNNLPAREMRERQRAWLRLYRAHGIKVDAAYVTAAFGCNFEGHIPLDQVMQDFRWVVGLCRENDVPLPNLYLADTMGWANPQSIKRAIAALRQTAPEARIGLHLHDTRGLGIANVYAALEMGVDLFATSVAGLGGCPFAGHSDHMASGNICTEDAVFLCHELGIKTGIDLDTLIEAARLAERTIGRPLMGRVMHSGSLNAYSKQH
jgi:hydroxymethylglutaryl-CoA lyase